MKNILMPTDFSDNAWNAIKYAIHLYEQENCKFHFLHTYTPTTYANNYNIGGEFIEEDTLFTKDDKVYQASEKELHNLVKKIAAHYPNNKHSYEAITAFNILTDEINILIDKRNIDIVILGKLGNTGTKEMLFGSHTIHIMNKANCPVLAIPTSYSFRYIDDVLFPIDYKYPYTENNLFQIKEQANLNEAIVHLFHVSNEAELSEEQQENKANINRYFNKTLHDFVEVPEEKIATAIHDYIIKNNIGLLALTHRKHSFLERLVFKQTVPLKGMHLSIPILILPIK